MAIYKTINSKTAIKTHSGLKNCLSYVLHPNKVLTNNIYVIGSLTENVSPESIYKEFIDVKKQFNKDNDRMYMHNIISFHPDEKITPEIALSFAIEFSEKTYPNHQSVIAIHTDKEHIHAHIVVNTVSFIDGAKIHKTQSDLKTDKMFCNDLCIKYNLSITEKGKHFDKTDMPMGEITAWNQNKYHLFIKSRRESYLVDCGLAVLNAIKSSKSKSDFINCMTDNGWETNWSDNRKNIVFKNRLGEKVRGTNIKKFFNIDVTKEGLMNEFNRNRTKSSERKRLLFGDEIERRKHKII